MMIRITFILLFSIISSGIFAEYVYNERCRQAFEDIFSLKIHSARKILLEEKEQNPANVYALYLENYCDVMELIVTEDESKYERFREDFYVRRDIMDEDDEDSPYHLMLKSEMYFTLGLAYMKFGSKLKGASKIYYSYQLIKENQEKFPGFWMNDKMAGVYSMIFANIPPVVRWAARILGLRGDTDKGFRQLKDYYERAIELPGYAEESILFMNFSYKLRWKEEEGYRFLADLDPVFYNSVLITYFYANDASFSAENDLALKLLENVDRNSLEIEFYWLDYLTGRCKLNRLDKDADIFLKKYLDNFPGEDYKKDVCNRLSWFYLLQDDKAGFHKYRNMVKDVGSDLRDRDREAILESELPYEPNVQLLKARLLFDGGYYHEADSVLAIFLSSSVFTVPYALEYDYRKGRIYQKLSKYDQAISKLQMTIDQGKDEPYTFAVRAALQLGLIYEEQHNYEKAAEYFNLCIDLYDSDHTVAGVENKAEKRLEKVEEQLN